MTGAAPRSAVPDAGPRGTGATAVVPAAGLPPARIAEALRSRGQTLAVAESLTGGQVCAALVDLPGVSAVLRGAVVAYATDLKASLLGVAADLLEAEGPVHPEVARQMAAGAARRLGADWALATTGVAGPGPADGHPAGTVHVAVHGPHGTWVRGWELTGPRTVVRRAATRAALALLADRVGAGEQSGPTGR